MRQDRGKVTDCRNLSRRRDGGSAPTGAGARHGQASKVGHQSRSRIERDSTASASPVRSNPRKGGERFDLVARNRAQIGSFPRGRDTVGPARSVYRERAGPGGVMRHKTPAEPHSRLSGGNGAGGSMPAGQWPRQSSFGAHFGSSHFSTMRLAGSCCRRIPAWRAAWRV